MGNWRETVHQGIFHLERLPHSNLRTSHLASVQTRIQFAALQRQGLLASSLLELGTVKRIFKVLRPTRVGGLRGSTNSGRARRIASAGDHSIPETSQLEKYGAIPWHISYKLRI